MTRRTSLVPICLALMLVASAACRTTQDTSKLTDQGLRNLKALQVTKVVNDATNAVIAANHSGVVSDALELQILTINKQVLDAIEANPVTFGQAAFAIAKNARDALPAEVRTTVDRYLGALFDILGVPRQ